MSIPEVVVELKQVTDATGRPICVRCNTRVWESDVWCEACLEIVSREVEAISFQPLIVVGSDHE